MPRHPPDDLDRLIGRELRHLREARGLTQQQLATALDISFQQIQKYERGANRIAASTWLRAREWLGGQALALRDIAG